jgi:hypothetical protein
VKESAKKSKREWIRLRYSRGVDKGRGKSKMEFGKGEKCIEQENNEYLYERKIEIRLKDQ